MPGMTAEQVTATVEKVAGDLIAKWKEERKESKLDSMLERLVEAQRHVPTPEERAKERGLKAGRFLRALAITKGDNEKAAAFVKKEWKDEEMAKALEASSATAGGVLVPAEFSTEIIELLRERAIFRSLGPRIIPMPTGSMTIPKITGGTAASYIGENQNLPNTQPTFGQVKLSWKKMAALTPISNDLLRFDVVDADAIVRDDLVAGMAWREDQAFIRDDGTEFAPTGVFYQSLAANRVAMTATPDLDKVTADLANAILRLRNANVRMISPVWILAPRVEMCLKTIRDGNGNLVFAAEMATGRLFGIPYGSSTVIPINLGGGTESEVYLLDMADVIIGEANTLEVDASNVAAYHDGSNVVAAFSLDQTVIKVLAHHDLAVRHPESITIITGVTWAPGSP
jgi:HK97 family phage major capsid protein